RAADFVIVEEEMLEQGLAQQLRRQGSRDAVVVRPKYFQLRGVPILRQRPRHLVRVDVEIFERREESHRIGQAPGDFISFQPEVLKRATFPQLVRQNSGDFVEGKME